MSAQTGRPQAQPAGRCTFRGAPDQNGSGAGVNPTGAASFWLNESVELRQAAHPYCTVFIMSKIGRYIATTMPPTTTPSTTIIIGSINESSAPTATSTSSS
jgi:hypothetical protein